MAQSVYSGLQGHGKSYEVVRGVILPNVAKGRRVVTNVAGLQIEKIRAYCVEKLNADPGKLGEIVNVGNDDLTRPNFFPKENEDNSACIVQGGDVIIIDECWRWYVTGERLPDGHLTFFRMHRHFTHPNTGQACDIVLIVQAIDDLQRKVRATVEKSFLMKKHKDLGLTNRYSVTVFSGSRQTRASVSEQFQESYKSEIFALYSSYSQSQAAEKREDQADGRGNLMNSKFVKYGLPLAVLSLIGAVYSTWQFFHPDKPVEKKVTPGGAVQGIPGAPGQQRPEPGVSDRWRLVGTVMTAGRVSFMLADGSGRIRYVENPPAFKYGVAEIELALPSGEIVTRWSGAAPVVAHDVRSVVPRP